MANNEAFQRFQDYFRSNIRWFNIVDIPKKRSASDNPAPVFGPHTLGLVQGPCTYSRALFSVVGNKHRNFALNEEQYKWTLTPCTNDENPSVVFFWDSVLNELKFAYVKDIYGDWCAKQESPRGHEFDFFRVPVGSPNLYPMKDFESDYFQYEAAKFPSYQLHSKKVALAALEGRVPLKDGKPNDPDSNPGQSNSMQLSSVWTDSHKNLWGTVV